MTTFTMDKTVWTLLTMDNSGDCMQVFSTYEKASAHTDIGDHE